MGKDKSKPKCAYTVPEHSARPSILQRSAQFPFAINARTKIYPPPWQRPHTSPMRHAPTVSISNLALTRLMLWAGLWLMRLLGWFAFENGAFNGIIDKHLRTLRRVIEIVIVLRVLKRMRPCRRSRPWMAARQDGWRRAAIGSALRRALRARGVENCIAALNAAIANVEVLVARLAHRLRRGLSRRSPVAACAGSSPALEDLFALPLAADTS